MGSVNRVILVGNLGRDAELRFIASGTAVANFSLATTESYKDKEGAKKEETEWFRVNYWGKGAEAITQYLTKGKQVYVEGRLQSRKWSDKDGVEKTTVEVRADRVVLLGGGARREDSAHESSSPRPGGTMPADDEVPF